MITFGEYTAESRSGGNFYIRHGNGGGAMASLAEQVMIEEILQLRERLAAVEKAFADAERDRMADIQSAVRQERIHADAEFERLRASHERRAVNCQERGDSIGWNDARKTITEIDTARARLVGVGGTDER